MISQVIQWLFLLLAPAGFRSTDGSFNNLTANTNFWSSSESGSNAWRRNLNSGHSTVNRWANNKGNGFSVRCVGDLIYPLIGLAGIDIMSQLHLIKRIDEEDTLVDLFSAYFDARRNKRNTINALIFERNFESSLFLLFEEIMERRYEPKKSICFVVDKPVKREIFAANFRDRVIHHFICNYISPIFEKTLINDTYSCRKRKGVHYGIRRADHFIRSCSRNYKKDCYILKLDIKEYFMSINKDLLYCKVKKALLNRKGNINFDLSLMLYLLEKTIYNDPTSNCIIKGKKSDWVGLPRGKSLFGTRPNCGLSIGNLTSQLFGNVYLDDFDHFVKRDLGIRYYGRYVDDFVIIHEDKKHLKSIIPRIMEYLADKLNLTIHPKKIYLQHYTKGVKFLGVVIKPHRTYIANRTKGSFYNTMEKYNRMIEEGVKEEELESFLSSINSFLGMMSHWKTYRLRNKMILGSLNQQWLKFVSLNKEITKCKLRKN